MFSSITIHHHTVSHSVHSGLTICITLQLIYDPERNENQDLLCGSGHQCRLLSCVYVDLILFTWLAWHSSQQFQRHAIGLWSEIDTAKGAFPSTLHRPVVDSGAGTTRLCCHDDALMVGLVMFVYKQIYNLINLSYFEYGLYWIIRPCTDCHGTSFTWISQKLVKWHCSNRMRSFYY